MSSIAAYQAGYTADFTATCAIPLHKKTALMTYWNIPKLRGIPLLQQHIRVPKVKPMGITPNMYKTDNIYTTVTSTGQHLQQEEGHMTEDGLMTQT